MSHTEWSRGEIDEEAAGELKLCGGWTVRAMAGYTEVKKSEKNVVNRVIRN